MPYAEYEKINFLTIRGSNRYAAETIKTVVYMHMEPGFARIAVLGGNTVSARFDGTTFDRDHIT